MVQTAIAVVQTLKRVDLDTTTQKGVLVDKLLESKEAFGNAVKLRRYLRQLADVAMER